MTCAYACNHAWDEYDPRLSSASSTASTASSAVSSGSSGGAGGTSASTSSSASTSNSASASNSASGSASSSSSSSSSSGALLFDVDGGVCISGASCYTGALSNLDAGPAGTCAPGTWSCTPDGGFVACDNETLPAPDDCSTGQDEDCDGIVNDHCGVWALGWGVTAAGATSQAYSVTATDAGHVMVAGGLHGAGLTWSNDAGPTTEEDGVFTLELNEPSALTVDRYQGGSAAAVAAALDGDGGAYLAGALYGNSTLHFGTLPLSNTAENASYYELFAGRVTDEVPAWLASYVAPAVHDVLATSVALGSAGDVYVGGTYTGAIPLYSVEPDGGLDAGTLTAGTGGSGLILALNQANGALAWALSFGATKAARVDTLATYTSGAKSYLLAGGSFSDAELSLPGGGRIPGNGGIVGLLLIVDEAGVPLRGKPIPAGGNPAGTVHVDSVAVDRAHGGFVAAGRFSGTVDFGQPAVALDVGDAGAPDAGAGPGPCGTAMGMSSNDMFVMRLASDLTCEWVQTFGNGSGFAGPSYAVDGFYQRSNGFGPQVALDNQGSIYVAANLADAATFGSWTVATAPAIVLMNMAAADGAPSWVRAFPAGTNAYATGIATDGSGAIYLTGQFQPKLEIVPYVPLTWPTTVGHDATFLAKIN